MEIISEANSGKKQSILVGIFNSDHWIKFLHKYYHRIRPSVLDNINRILKCNTDLLWFATLKCHCWYSTKIFFSCKSRFCSRCGKPACDKWMQNVYEWSLPDMKYRHFSFTIPEQLRTYFIKYRDTTLNLLFTASSNTIKYCFKKNYDCLPWFISVLHTFWWDIKWNPHMHMVITNWWLSFDKKSWKWFTFIPYKLLRESWKYNLNDSLKKWGKSYLSQIEFEKLRSLLSFLYQKKRYFYDTNVFESLIHAVKYVGRYLKRPVIAETRIKSINGDSICFSFKDKLTQKIVFLTLSIEEFIGKIIKHIPDKYFKAVRYGGVFANRCKNTNLIIINNLISTWKDKESNNISPNNRRETLTKFTGIDPYKCPICSKIMHIVSLHIRLNNNSFRTIPLPP